MWKNILIIFIIILLSYIFTLKDKNYFDLQILFIVLSIAILIIYKLMFIRKLNKKEHFDTNHQDVSNFFQQSSSNSQPSQTKNVEFDQLSEQLKALQTAVQFNKKSNTGKENNLEKEDLAFKNQENDINLLEKKVEELKEYLYLSNEEKNEKFYKKIPVLNSCKLPSEKKKIVSSKMCEMNTDKENCETNTCSWDDKTMKCADYEIKTPFDQEEFIQKIFTKFASSVSTNPEFKINLS